LGEGLGEGKSTQVRSHLGALKHSINRKRSAGSLLAQSFLPRLFLKVHNPLPKGRGLAINRIRSAGSLLAQPFLPRLFFK
jgi:hypothetical protein